MPTISKLKSGKFQVRQMVDGERFSFTIDHRPSDREAERLMLRYIKDHKKERVGPQTTFAAAAASFVALSEGVLSASTIREYSRMEKYLKTHYPRFVALQIGRIDSSDLQKIISDYAKGKDPSSRSSGSHRSAKSVSNLYGFMVAVIRSVDPDAVFRVTLPEIQKPEPYIPTDDEVRAVAEALRGTRFEICVILASLGLRRSEIAGLDIADVGETSIRIHQVKVQDKNGTWVIKDHGKTPSSTRTVEIPSYLSQLIHAQGYVYKGSPNRISIKLNQVQDKLGIRRFSVHKLRHFYASSCMSLSVPLTYIQRAGGWKTDTVLKRIYLHAQADRQKEIDRVAMDHIASLVANP